VRGIHKLQFTNLSTTTNIHLSKLYLSDNVIPFAEELEPKWQFGKGLVGSCPWDLDRHSLLCLGDARFLGLLIPNSDVQSGSIISTNRTIGINPPLQITEQLHILVHDCLSFGVDRQTVALC